MASSADTIIYELLKCGICQEIMKCPKTLPCVHTFCKDCIDNVHKNRTNLTNEAQCPICRRSFVLDYSGAGGLPDNFYFNKILSEYEERLESQRPVSEILECEKCSGHLARRHCFHCNKILCGGCATNHDSFQEHAHHKMCELSKLTDKDRQNVLRIVKLVSHCDKHSLRPTRFCNSCETSVCPECYVTSHQTHKTESIDTAQQARDNMMITQRKVKHTEISLKSELTKTEENIKNLKGDKARLTEDVKEFFRTFKQRVNDEEERLMRNVESMYDADLREALKTKEEIEESVNSVEDLIGHIDSVTKIGPDIFIVSEKNQITFWASQLENNLRTLKVEPTKNSRVFVVEKMAVESLENKIGRIELREAYCTYQGVMDGEDEDIYCDGGNSLPASESFDDHREVPQNPPDLPAPNRPLVTSKYAVPRADSMISFSTEVKDKPNESMHRNSNSSSDFGKPSNPLYENDKPSAVTFTREKRIKRESGITGIAVTKENEIIAVCNKGNSCLIFDEGGNFVSEVKKKLKDPWDVDTVYNKRDRRSIIYVTDGVSGKVEGSIKYFAIHRGKTEPCKTFIRDDMQPSGIATTPQHLLVCDKLHSMVRVYGYDGKLIRKIGSGVDDCLFKCPMYISRKRDNVFIVSDKEQKSLIVLDEKDRVLAKRQTDSSCFAQTTTDGNGCVFAGSFDESVVYAFFDDTKEFDLCISHTLKGSYHDITRPVALAVDIQNRIWVGHDNGLDLLQTQFRFIDI